jgi:hypothetical protein
MSNHRNRLRLFKHSLPVIVVDLRVAHTVAVIAHSYGFS